MAERKNYRFKRVVLDAAKDGKVDEVVAAVASHPHLIDTPNNDGWTDRTPLHMAAESGHVRVVEKLIELGSKAIDTPNNDGWTPLYWAAFNGHVSVIEALVRLGSKAIDTPNRSGDTPLQVAALNSHEKCLNALRWLGADCSNVSTKWMPEDMTELLRAPVDEDQAAEIRYRVFFSQSLVGRLLCLPFATDDDEDDDDRDDEE